MDKGEGVGLGPFRRESGVYGETLCGVHSWLPPVNQEGSTLVSGVFIVERQGLA